MEEQRDEMRQRQENFKVARQKAKEVRDKIVAHNPYADAIGRESVIRANATKAWKSAKAAKAKITTSRETTSRNTTIVTTNNDDDSSSNNNDRDMRTLPHSAAAAVGPADDDDPLGVGGGMDATTVEKW
ncbi:unnamed protein product [Ectocarpus sp. 12 AP-2014]